MTPDPAALQSASRRIVIKAGIATAACALVTSARLFGNTTADQLSQPARGQEGDLTAPSIRATADLVRRRKVSPLELTRACLARIDHHGSRGADGRV